MDEALTAEDTQPQLVIRRQSNEEHDKLNVNEFTTLTTLTVMVATGHNRWSGARPMPVSYARTRLQCPSPSPNGSVPILVCSGVPLHGLLDCGAMDHQLSGHAHVKEPMDNFLVRTTSVHAACEGCILQRERGRTIAFRALSTIRSVPERRVNSRNAAKVHSSNCQTQGLSERSLQQSLSSYPEPNSPASRSLEWFFALE